LRTFFPAHFSSHKNKNKTKTSTKKQQITVHNIMSIANASASIIPSGGMTALVPTKDALKASPKTLSTSATEKAETAAPAPKKRELSPDSAKVLDTLVAKVKAAQKLYADFSQEQVDTIFRAAALAAADARIPLAKMAAEESGMGVIEDKVIKNHFASEYIYNKYKDDKTCGILETDEEMGTMTIAGR
jgi:acyl-CoA reductase-like NAD-dependent aldehyde dehydrogenase